MRIHRTTPKCAESVKNKISTAFSTKVLLSHIRKRFEKVTTRNMQRVVMYMTNIYEALTH